MSVWKSTAVVFVGSGIGGSLRFLIYAACLRLLPVSRFPFATLTVNVLGSFLIAFIAHVSLTTALISPSTRLFLTVGVMGGLTTYSTFNQDVIDALGSGRPATAAVTAASMLVLCLVAGSLGLIAARALYRG